MKKIIIIMLLFNTINLSISDIQAKEQVNSGIRSSKMQKMNHDISNTFDEAFIKMNADELVKCSDKILPSLNLKNISNIEPVKAEYKDNSSKLASLQTEDLVVTVNEKARFHIFSNGERLTLDSTDVPETRWDNWKNEDRTIDEIRDIIFGGRSLDPYPQKSWNDKEIINSNWPDLKTTLGPVNLDFNKSGITRSIFINPVNSEVGSVYGVIPKGIIALNSDSSVVMAFQVENVCKKNDPSTGKPYTWAPWTIIPLKVSEKGTANNPTELVAFPGKLKQPGDKKWSEININKTNFVVLNPYVFGTTEPEKTFYSDTNWAIMARKGSDKIILMRTMHNHTDQFQVYNGQPEYVELEATGPLVNPGEKSTVITRLDFIKLSELNGISFKKFGETGNLNAEITEVLKSL